MKNIEIGSKWIFKNSKNKVYVFIKDIEKWFGNKFNPKNNKYVLKLRGTAIIYGIKKSGAGHISQSFDGFLNDYEQEHP